MPLDALEYVVRPYTTPNAQGQVIIPSTPVARPQSATLKWGATATMPQVSTGINFQVVCCKDDLNEKTRKTEQVRVYQDGDKTSPNYIDYEYPLSMNLDKKETNTCGDNWDDISVVAQEVNADLAGWQDLMQQVTGAPANCGQSWNFKSQLSQSQ
jgi:hypothetical protein